MTQNECKDVEIPLCSSVSSCLCGYTLMQFRQRTQKENATAQRIHFKKIISINGVTD
jgi:hypothetical protein